MSDHEATGEAPVAPAPDAEEVAAAATKGDTEAIAAVFGGLKKKKKKKKKKDKGADAEAPSTSGAGGEAGGTADDADLTYDDMLDRVYEQIHANNPELTDRKKFKMKPPQVMRVGSTRTCWVNFTEICKMMNRQPEHVLNYVLTELGTTGSVDGSARLVLKGKFQPRGVENLLRNYIKEYVTCMGCRSLNTTLTRDQVSRLYIMDCKTCGANRSVVAIKAGFRAVGRGDRRKARHAGAT